MMTRKEYNKICAERVYNFLLNNMENIRADRVELMDVLDYLYDIINDTDEMREYAEDRDDRR